MGRGAEWTEEDLKDLDEQLGRLPKKFTVESTSLREIRMEPQSAGVAGFNDGQIISVKSGEVDWALIHEIGHNFDNENPKWKQFQAISGWKDVSGKFDKISDDYEGNSYVPHEGTARLKRDGKIYKDGDMIDLDGDGTIDGIVQVQHGKVKIHSDKANFYAPYQAKDPYKDIYAAVNPLEDFAETFKYFFQDPESLKKKSPEKFQFMVDYVGYDPTQAVYRPVPIRI